MDENSPQGTTLFFPDPPAPRVRDDDPGDKGVFSLQLIGNNGTFEISPSVGDRDVTFLIRVRDPAMLDYEKMPVLSFQVIKYLIILWISLTRQFFNSVRCRYYLS